MNCREIRQRLAEDPEVAGSDPRIAEHLQECARCRDLREKLGELDAALADLPRMDPPDQLVQRTLERVRRRARLHPVVRWSLAIGTPVVLLLIGVVVFSDYMYGDNMERDQPWSSSSGAEPEVVEVTTEEWGHRRMDHFGKIDLPKGGGLGGLGFAKKPSSGYSVGAPTVSLHAVAADRPEETTPDQLTETVERGAGRGGERAQGPVAGGFLGGRQPRQTERFEVLSSEAGRLGDRSVRNVPAKDEADTKGKRAGTQAAGPEAAEAPSFIPARGYFRNTYLPGDPTLQWLRQSLAAGLYLDGQQLVLERDSTPYRQPFDPPATAGLAVFLSADPSAVEGPTRMRIQVGLKGSERHARRRSALNAVLVVDLRDLPDEQARRTLWNLADAMALGLQAGDRFWLLAAGIDRPLLIEPGRFGPTAARRALANALLDTENAKKRSAALVPALRQAYGLLAGSNGEESPLGANLVLLATAGGPGVEAGALLELAHQHAVLGVTTSTVGVGPNASARQLAELALAGQGRRRLVATAEGARRAMEQELSASGSVVARAVRLRIRLADGVKLVGVLGSEPLSASRTERVRQAEQAIDRRVARTLGIDADRGQDEAGIQIVIPAYYAADEHVILLDVVAPGPGRLADVQVRYKDLVNLRNAVARARLSLPAGHRPDDPRGLNVAKNHLAHLLSVDLHRASAALREGLFARCQKHLIDAQSRIEALRSRAPRLADDPELRRDETMLAGYRRVLADRIAWQAKPQVRDHLARSLACAARNKLAPQPRR